MQHRYWSRWLALLVVAVIALGFSGGLSAGWNWGTQKLQQFGILSAPQVGSQDADAAGEEPPEGNYGDVPVIGPSTELEFRTRYLPCDLEALESYTADVGQLGQSREQFLMYNPEWELVEFSTEHVVAEREVRGRCERLMAHRTIKLDGSRVTVYFGSGGPHSPVMNVTDITADELVAGDRERLRQGVTVDSEADVWLLLEGLTN